MSLSILLILDNDILRAGLRQIIHDVLDVVNLEEISSFDDGIEHLREMPVDMILLDSRPGNGDPAERVRQLKSVAPGARVAALATQMEAGTLLGTLAAGAHGCITLDSRSMEIEHALREVAMGRIYVAPDLHLADDGRQTLLNADPLGRLSKRQMQIAQELASGARTKEIARRLGLSEGTVKLHVSAVYRVLGCESRAEAAAILSRLFTRD